MKRIFGSLLLVSLAGCSGAEGFNDGRSASAGDPANATPRDATGVAQTQQGLGYLPRKLWPPMQIRVCFNTDENSPEAAAVREAVERTWESVADIDFVNWDNCSAHGLWPELVIDSDIRINWSYWNAPSSLLGSDSRNDLRHESMNLNQFTGAKRNLTGGKAGEFDRCFGSETARTQCIASYAVRAFGTALGFPMEEERTDSPAGCAGTRDDSITAASDWDTYSVMNGCNPQPVNTDKFRHMSWLSPMDIAGAQQAYGRPSADFLWLSNTYQAPAKRPFWFQTSNLPGRTAERPFVGDFNGDGASDVFWYRPGSATDRIWYGSRGLVTDPFETSAVHNVSGTYIPLVGRFARVWEENGSVGADGIYWYSPDGTDHLWLGRSDKTFAEPGLPKQFGHEGNFQPFTGDFDGNGFTDIFWYQPGSGADYIWWNDTITAPNVLDEYQEFHEQRVEVTGNYIPIVGAFDNIYAPQDILWYGVGNQTDFIWYGKRDQSFDTSKSLWKQMSKGLQPIAGNFMGDRMTDIIWNKLEDDNELSSEVVWEFREDGGTPRTTTTAVHGFYTPLVGDFNGDFQSDVYWYQPR